MDTRADAPARLPDTAVAPEAYALPASAAQERLWFFSQLVPDLGVYNLGCPFEVGGPGDPVDLAALRAAVELVVGRHETLRTCLAVRDGQLVQLVHPALPVAIDYTDLRGFSPAVRAEREAELCRADAAAPFALDRAPLWRASVLHRTDEQALLLFTVQHAVFDAKSANNFGAELSAAYRAIKAGRAPELPELALQYGDYAAWQRGRLDGGELDGQLAYWRERLTELPAPLALPVLGGAGGRDGEHAGAQVGFDAAAELTSAVRALARSRRGTPFAVLLAAFAALLSRLTGETDLLVGSPVSGRERPELVPLIGMFVNTVVLRIDCAGDPSFGELVDRVRDTVLDALEHQDLPYDRLVSTLAPDRDAGGSPLHQVVFNLLPGKTNDQVRNGTAKVDLLIDLAERPDGIEGQLEYRTDLFDEPAAAELAARYLRLLAAGSADAGTRLSQLPLLSTVERDRLLAARPAAGEPALVLDRFAEWVRRTPDAVAVAAGDRRLSYAELDAAAGRVAARLGPLRPDAPVAVLVEDGIELPVAVLGVLRAGAAYLPLDPGLPADRLAFLLADSGAVAAVAAGPVPAAVAAALPVLDLTAGTGPAAPAELPPPHPDALAYLTYTSGSTGRPKAVAVAHRQLAGYLAGILPVLAAPPGAVFGQLQPLTFDFGATTFWAALCSGGTLHVLPRGHATEPARVADFMRANGIEYAKLTPSHLRALRAGHPDPDALLPGRLLLLGGEASTVDWVAELRATGRLVVNHYGPTETTVGVLALPAGADLGAGPTTPLGHPLAHAAAYVLDAAGALVPDGVPGELYVGGGTVSRGYLGRPGLTAERFVPDPYGAIPGGRLYRTGDRVRRLPGGALEFLGRTDDQVKIRGHRVELGEVRQVLAAAPGVTECAVVLSGGAAQAGSAGGGDEPRLVAYVVGTGDLDAVRAHAAAQLPAYMVPAVLVPLAELPRAAHGKLDTARLPAPGEPAGAERPGADRPPAGRAEELVAAAFEQLLGRDRVGRADGFFALGGHSLLAIQLMSRLRAAFGVALPVRAVFEDPTVAGLAARVESRLAERAAPLPPVTPVPRDRPLPASWGQRRLWFLHQLEADQLEAGAAVYNTHVCLDVTGELDPGRLHAALLAVAARHEVLRTRFTDHDGELWQQVVAEPAVPFAVAAAGADPDAVLAEHAGGRFDLAHEPPLRALLLRHAADRHTLLVVLHHVANDAWSANLLVTELAEHYAALTEGRAPELPALPVQYADYAAWQRDLLTGELRDTQLRWWTERLAGLPDRLPLPTDRPRPARQGHAGGHVPLRLGASTVDRLRAVGAAENASLFMVLLAGFTALLGRCTGQDDVAVGTPVSSRPRPELEPLLGFFLNTLVLRTDLTGDPDFRELVRRVRTSTLDSFGNQEVPFEALVEQLRPARDLGGSPLVQVLFTLEDTERVAARAGGLRLDWRPYGTPTAKFDLSLYLWRRPDGLAGALEYRTDLFEEATVRRLAGQLTALLEAVAADPAAVPSRVELAAADAALVRGWNDTTRPLPFTAIPDQVVATAAAHPDAPALIWPGGTTSYRDFVAGVDRLAGALAAAGVRPGDVVGVLAERGPELVTAVHAVQAAGAAYLPLDPAHPVRRLAFQCGDAAVRAVVTSTDLADLAGGLGAPVVVAGGELPPAARPAVTLHPDGPAYVIYTSGSTGRPKGVVVPHRAIANRLAWMQSAFPLDRADRVLHKTPAGFDVSVWELFWPLLTGAALVIAAPGGHRDPAYLAALLADQAVTTVHFVPSMLDAFLTAAPAGLAGRLPVLRRIVCSGEALPPGLVARCHAALPGVAVENLYGPTEAAVDVSWHHCEPGEWRTPIGAPIANTRLHVLDRHGLPAPVGVPGELCLAGVQLATGYLNRPGLTAERFVPDPDGPPGTRRYRTGDLARWLPAGEVEYLGRLDDQVKIRGMRVEPGEVEAALLTHPGVRAAAVLARDGALAGYVVPADPAAPPEVESLRAHLAAALPPHLVPAAWCVLPELPLSANGKLDRAALPAATLVGAAGYAEPATGAERAVAAVWESVLGVDRVGAGDDFFAAGGDSIRALKVLARLRAAGYGVELAQLFAHQTVRELAAVLVPAAGAGAAPAPDPYGLLPGPVAAVVRAAFPDAVDAYPLTTLQAGMLFHSEQDRTGATYHQVFTIRLAGVDHRPGALRAAVAAAVARHPVLRTSLHVGEFAEPLQVVHAGAELPVVELDHTGAEPAAVPALLDRFEAAERERRFEPAVAPLLRLFLHRLPAGELALTLSFQHAILDGWSVATLTTELLRGWAGEPPGPAPAAVFRDAVAAELTRRADPAAAAHWAGVLADAPDSRLPRQAAAQGAADAGPGPVETLRTELAGDVVAGLDRAARTVRVPVRAVLLAAHLRALALLTGAAEAVTGVVTQSRPEAETGAQALGMFLNTVPVRARVDLPSWAELARRVHAAEVAAIPHRAYPLAEMRRTTGGRVFDVLFDYRDFHVYGDLPAGGPRVTGYQFFEQTDVPFAVNLIRGAGGTLTLQFRYDRWQFGAGQVDRVRDLYLRVLAAVAADPAADPRPTGALLGADTAAIEAWNDTGTAGPTRAVPDRVAAQARATPHAPALIAAGRTVTYAGFLAAVYRLANHLTGSGVRPGDVVGVCLKRGADLVVAVHAVLAAGAAYLPLEPDLPAARLAFMAADAGAAVVLTHTDLAGPFDGRRAIRLDTDPAAGAPDTPPAVPIDPDALAYVIYTSGSTGRPKGVGVGHRAIANRLDWMQDSYRLTPADRVLHKTPFGFDVSVWELCWPLQVGAAMVIADPGGHRDPAHLAALSAAHGVTTVHFVPSMLDAVLDQPDLAGFGTVRLVFCSGEALPAALADRLLRALPGAALHNLYGPTEAAVDVTAQPCRAGAGAVPIGRPVPNTRIEVVDPAGERVPVGSPGELCIGGVQLARGYLGRPGLTADRFVPDRYGPAGGRLYRTGDLARWLPDGTLDYLGRLDHQVKLRGFRVELGEIEAALTALPGVRAAAVLARTARDGGRRLVAYVVPASGGPADADTGELARALRARLPEHMVPAGYVPLAELPTTVNGKLDRAALPEPAAPAAAYEPPAAGPERAVADIWRDVLDADRVGATDDFFTLGGDSIRGLRVVARLRAAGWQLRVTDLYRHPTVRALAAALAAAAPPAAAPPAAGPAGPAESRPYGLVNAADLAVLARRFGGTNP
jgi:amino acid adenylation domain-containing protein